MNLADLSDRFSSCNAPGVEAPSRPAKDAAPRTSSPERFIDVSSLLSDFNPLKESHLVRWSDSDDEYDAMIETVELPQAWEEGEGAPQAPEWVDYRNGSDSDGEGLTGLAPEDATEPRASSLAASILGAASPAGVVSAYSAEGGFQEMHASELFERLATGQVALLLDVRRPEEYGTGHVAGARNVPLDDLSGAVRGGELEEWRHKPVAVVCGSGQRSAQATVRLTRVLGFTHVTNVAGGIAAWRAEGLPLEGEVRMPTAPAGGCGCGAGGSGSGGCRSGGPK